MVENPIEKKFSKQEEPKTVVKEVRHEVRDGGFALLLLKAGVLDWTKIFQ